MNIEIDNEKLEFDLKKFQKMLIIFNALEDGWTISKKEEQYVFKKKHENKEEYFSDEYIKEFMSKYLHH